jgi:3-hydroxyisobutyrate dehydrogenase-like beta-hydroxyacid dehydrogenase
MSGVFVSGLAEGLALCDRAGIKQADLLDVLKATHLDCPLVRDTVQAVIDGRFPARHSLQHLQKDLNLVTILRISHFGRKVFGQIFIPR